MKDSRFSKIVLFVNCLVPFSLLLWDIAHKNVGPNPLEFATRTTGTLTLVFLLFSLAITPLRKITGLNSLANFRRMLGLFAFFYGFLHLTSYIWFDRFFNLREAIADVMQRPFIAVGMTAFALMIPLAITSTNKMVKRLGGKRWAMLHRLAYLAAVAGVLHFWMLVKSDTRTPLTFGFLLFLLLAHRLFVKFYPPETTARQNSFLPR